jgi:hypothetical protein
MGHSVHENAMIFEGPSSRVNTVHFLSLFYLLFALQAPPPNPEPDEAVDANFNLALPFDDHLVHWQEETPAVTPLPTKRVRRPTERALAMFNDNMPEGPGILESDNDDEDSMTLDSPLERQPSPLRIRI